MELRKKKIWKKSTKKNGILVMGHPNTYSPQEVIIPPIFGEIVKAKKLLLLGPTHSLSKPLALKCNSANPFLTEISF